MLYDYFNAFWNCCIVIVIKCSQNVDLFKLPKIYVHSQQVHNLLSCPCPACHAPCSPNPLETATNNIGQKYTVQSTGTNNIGRD